VTLILVLLKQSKAIVITRATLCTARTLPSCGVCPSASHTPTGNVSKRLKLS